jgi:TRAP transporter TAXI family solute receptor
MKVVAVASILAALPLAACQRQQAPQAPPARASVLRLVHTWGNDAAGVERTQAALAESLSDLRVELTFSVSELAVQMLQRDEIDAAFTYSNIAYSAYSGQQSGKRLDRIRAIAELPPRAIQIVVGPHSGISSVKDLRGKRISFGIAGGGAGQIAEMVLGAYGISRSDVIADYVEAADAARKIVRGELDALLTHSYPNAGIGGVTDKGGTILDIAGGEIDRLRTAYPLIKPMVIPPGTYPSIGRPIHTVGIDAIMICRTNLDEDIVYRLTRALIQAAGKNLGVEALKHLIPSAASSTAIPLHPGAARYYRERELLP